MDLSLIQFWSVYLRKHKQYVGVYTRESLFSLDLFYCLHVFVEEEVYLFIYQVGWHNMAWPHNIFIRYSIQHFL